MKLRNAKDFLADTLALSAGKVNFIQNGVMVQFEFNVEILDGVILNGAGFQA
jgi:hypothetical protein